MEINSEFKNKVKQVAVDAALIAGDILKVGFGTNFNISNKEGRNNLVTEYDNKAEDAIIAKIKSVFPEHSFLAEESGNSGNLEAEYLWIIDPLDGTVNFAHNMPIFSVSIAFAIRVGNKYEILVGVVYHPLLNELFTAIKGEGSYLNNNRIFVSKTSDFYSSYLVTGFPYDVNTNPNNCIENFVDIIKVGIPVRRLGSAALDLAYVAAGRFDAFWEVKLNAWDVAAGKILVEEAGGLLTQYDKAEYDIFGGTMIASNGLIHDYISDVLMNRVKI